MALDGVSRSLVRMLRQGCAWRDLDCEELAWRTVYGYFVLLRRGGVLTRALRRLARGSATAIRCLDATYVRVHQDGANPASSQKQELMGRSRGGLTSKIHLLCDSKGRPLRVLLGAGNRPDICSASAMVTGLKGGTLAADRGYDSDALRVQLYEAGVFPCIPTTRSRNEPRAFHRGHYKKRHTVENNFCSLKRLRRIATRYDKLASSYRFWVTLGCIRHWLK